MKKLLLLFTLTLSTIIILAQVEGDFESRQTSVWNDSDSWNEYEFPGIWNNTENTTIRP